MNLNQQQQEAVEHYGSPLVIIAGAGTGKTSVIISKIQHLIKSNNHNPSDILALTFTNKAANEMKERFASFKSTIQLTNIWHISFILPAFSKRNAQVSRTWYCKKLLQLLIHNSKKKSLV